MTVEDTAPAPASNTAPAPASNNNTLAFTVLGIIIAILLLVGLIWYCRK